MIFNGKENKEAGVICFEIRIPRKKNKELLRKVPSIFWFVNNFEWWFSIGRFDYNGA